MHKEWQYFEFLIDDLNAKVGSINEKLNFIIEAHGV